MQKDIYDREAGKVAIPGCYGYGALYPNLQSFGDEMDLLMWCMEAAPSRYAVRQKKASSGTTKWIIPGLSYFTGILEVNVAQPGVDVGSLMNVNKQLIFYGTEGDVYYNTFIADPSNPRFSGWFTFTKVMAK